MQNIEITKITETKGFDKDTMRIKGGELMLNINVLTGKQGDFFICYSPSINISGYGKTELEAEDFIKLEMRVFCEDLMNMNSKERENYLLSIGFKKERFHTKNFSKSYVDENGKLQDFDQGTLQHKLLTTT